MVDNDELVCITWKFAAEISGCNLSTYSEFNTLLKKIDRYKKNTIFYIDSDLGTETKGEEYAKLLFDLGYTNLYLTTGFSKMASIPSWIKSIINKTPPF